MKTLPSLTLRLAGGGMPGLIDIGEEVRSPA